MAATPLKEAIAVPVEAAPNVVAAPSAPKAASPPPAIAETPDFNKSDAAMICFLFLA